MASVPSKDPEKALKFYRDILMMDVLYHGPRNDLPDTYDPKGVIVLLNNMRDDLLCVRGNCDAEVDQMVLSFPILADYALLYLQDRCVFLTHGHLWNERILPPIGIGTVLAHGHTHVPELKKLECGLTIFNPGSVSLPKGGSARSFGYFDGNTLLHYCI
jgi:putative phosphoesterase